MTDAQIKVLRDLAQRLTDATQSYLDGCMSDREIEYRVIYDMDYTARAIGYQVTEL